MGERYVSKINKKIIIENLPKDYNLQTHNYLEKPKETINDLGLKGPNISFHIEIFDDVVQASDDFKAPDQCVRQGDKPLTLKKAGNVKITFKR
jgi:hypothetical protein